MQCSIIIVSWNVRAQLERCLRSIESTTDRATVAVFVVDNASTDSSADMVAIQFPWVRLIRNHTNKGFAAACNQAIKLTVEGHVLLLNPDTELREGTVSKVLACLATHSDAGIIGCRLVYPDGTTQQTVRRFPDTYSHILIMLKLHNFFPRYRWITRYYAHDFDYAHDAYVDQVMGAFFLIRRALITDVGLLDEGYYIWYEEVDYCRRARTCGWRTYYTSAATAVHHKGVSFKQRSPIRLQIILNNSIIRYFRVHETVWSACVLAALYPASLLLALVQQLTGVRKPNRQL